MGARPTLRPPAHEGSLGNGPMSESGPAALEVNVDSDRSNPTVRSASTDARLAKESEPPELRMT